MGWMETACFDALRGLDSAYLPLPEALQAVEFLLARRLRRQAATLCTETATELATTADVQAVVQRHEKAVADLARHHDGVGDGWTMGEDIQEETVPRIETGLKDWDRVTGGLPVGVVTILAARPGMGKTALACRLAEGIAVQGHGAGFVSLEMPKLDLLHRMASSMAYRPGPDVSGRTDNPYYADYENNRMGGNQLHRFQTGKARARQLPIAWDDTGGLTVERIRLGARRLKAKFAREGRELKLLIVDHLGHIKSDGKRDSRNLELGDMTQAFVALAKELQIAVVVLCQVNRDVEKRPDKRPTIPDLRESGRIEEDAHTILFLYRPAYYDEEAAEKGQDVDDQRVHDERFTLELHVAKNRGGPRKRIKLFCEIGANAIFDEAEVAAAMRPMEALL
jgi:replicative DNA helicase